MITSFTEEGEIDERKLRHLVDFLVKHVKGLFVCGSYGPGPLMTQEQRKKCVDIVADEVAGRVPSIVHVGCADTDYLHLISYKHAEKKVGAYRVVSTPPYYYSCTEEQVLNHFRRLVDAMSLPVYIYNNPKTVGYAITSETLIKLEEVGVVGVKDSFNK